MSTIFSKRKYFCDVAASLFFLIAGSVMTASAVGQTKYGFGTEVSEDELSHFISPLPDGRGLPVGAGTVEEGKKIYQQNCLACHGANLEGGIGDALIGGRDTLANNDPEKPPLVEKLTRYPSYETFRLKRSSFPPNPAGML